MTLKFSKNDWEQRKLGDMAEFSKGNGYSKFDLEDSGVPIILYGRLYTKYETVIDDVDTFAIERKGSIYSKGGEIIIPASGETSEDIARASVVKNEGFLIGGDLNIVRPTDDMDSPFLALSISHGRVHKDLASKAQGKSVVHIRNEQIQKLEIDTPCKSEQKRISRHFRLIEECITLHHRM